MTSVNEQELLNGIDRDEIVQLMKNLQSYRSFSGNEAEVMRFLAGWFTERGLNTELIDVSDEPGRPDLIVRIPGSGGGESLMLNGHLDIDPVPLNYPLDPWDCHEEDGRLTGHGLVNMKAGVTVSRSRHRRRPPLRRSTPRRPTLSPASWASYREASGSTTSFSEALAATTPSSASRHSLMSAPCTPARVSTSSPSPAHPRG